MRTSSTKWSGAFAAWIVIAAAAAPAATLSNPSIVKNVANSADILPAGSSTRALRSTTEVLNPTTTSFEARYAMTGVADNDAFATPVSLNATADYTVSWDVTAAPGESYVLEVGSSFRGGLGVIDDNLGFGIDSNPAATVSDLDCEIQGPGSVTGDSLDGFPSATSRNGTSDISGNDVVVGYAAGSMVHGVGNGSPQTYTIDCTFTAFAASGQGFFAADEAAFRFGANGPLSNSVMDDYPGPSGAVRTYQIDDGHRIAVSVKQLPPTTACNDGVDNDGDGLTDLDDLGCSWSGYDREDPACNDGIDNDGDGQIDLADSYCAGVPSNRREKGPSACGLFGIEPFALVWLFRKRRIG